MASNYAESWKNVYKQYAGDINFVAGDFDTLKTAIRQYIVNQIPENFNDFSDSSEVGMFSNSIAWLGENLHYRVDLSVHNLFPQTTERKQALLDFVKMLSYFPNRNNCALGLAKIQSVTTDEDIEDSLGNNLSGVTITWDDASNDNWQEQFLTVINAALASNNSFGSPRKTEQVGNITTQIYQTASAVNQACVYSFSASVNGNSLPFNVVNADIDLDTAVLYEPTPAPENAFQLIYRNDGAGNASSNTGFFVMWKQGELISQKYNFEERVQNVRLEPDNVNVNNTDVWFAEFDNSTGLTTTIWNKIEKGDYLAYNPSQSSKNSFKVETKDNDAIAVVFGDGNYTNIPYGMYRLWYRVSNGNTDIFIRPDDIQNVSISIPYYSRNTTDTNQYTLTIEFSVVDFSQIRQATATESLSTIRDAAPEVYSTQNRMVSAADYNRYPKIMGDSITVLKSILRTYSGNSRFIKMSDPTGTYTAINLLAKDGYLFGITDTLSETPQTSESKEPEKMLYKYVISKLTSIEIANLYYSMYDGYMIPADSQATSYTWVADSVSGATVAKGFFKDGTEVVPFDSINEVLEVGDSICFVDEENNQFWATVQGLEGTGVNYALSISPIPDTNKRWSLRHGDANKSEFSKMNRLNTYFTQSFLEELVDKVEVASEGNFGITFDALNRDWVITTDTSDDVKMIMLEGGSKVLNWFFRLRYNRPTETWNIESRSRSYIFGSKGENNFYFDTSKLDSNGNFITNDYVKVLAVGSKEYVWKPYDTISYDDGYVNPARFKAQAFDAQNSLNAINPMQFKEMTEIKSDTMVFYKDTETTVGEQLDAIIKDGTGIEGSMWGSTTESGYYYTRYKCTIYPAGTVLPHNIYAPINKAGTYTRLSNGKLRQFVGETFTKDSIYDFDIVEYVKSYDAYGIPTYFGEDGYAYQYDALNKELKQIPNEDIIIEKGLNNLIFLWVHYPTSKQITDPSTTNIVDMYIMTSTYYEEVENWIANGKTGEFPTPPTAYELESQYASLRKSKMISDTIIFHPVIYKRVFGLGSASSNKCLFKVMKANNLTSDNEIKQLVVSLIDSYFKEFSVGQSFFFTQMSTYIHDNSNGLIKSIVPVSANANDVFGTLFEIGCEENEMLLSTATVQNIQIVSTLDKETLNS